MRCMPNMLIAAPGDPMEVRACMRYLAAHPQPSYLRLDKAGIRASTTQFQMLRLANDRRFVRVYPVVQFT